MNELLLAAVAMLTGFCLGWSLRAALARAEKEVWFYDPISHAELESGKFTNNVESYRRYAAMRQAMMKDRIIDLTPAPPDFDRFPPTLILDGQPEKSRPVDPRFLTDEPTYRMYPGIPNT